MSGLAKLAMIISKFLLLILLIISSVISLALIFGVKSYVSTLGEEIKILSSPLKTFSSPPLKKKVT